jgi:hypothetical protein
MKAINIFFVFLIISCFSEISFAQVFTVAKLPWAESFGNHRAVIQVDKQADAVSIDFHWRRHDFDIANKRFLIIEAATGDTVPDIYREEVTNERCSLVFGPAKKAGIYYFYYLPYYPVTKEYHSGEYLSPENAPDQVWVKKHGLALAVPDHKDVSNALVSEIQARTEFQSFYPMEVVATKNEVTDYLMKYNSDYLVFPESRDFPIRMTEALPLRWIHKKPGYDFYGTAQKNEYYVLQLGVYASKGPVENVKLVFSELTDNHGNTISGKALTCFNTDGIDTWGKPFTKVVSIPHGRVQALWVGIDIPANVVAGIYEGYIVVKTDNFAEQKIRVFLTIEDRYLSDRGDSEHWRYSRLRWLNSTLGIDNEPVKPYIPMKVENRNISCLGRSVKLNDFGLPEEIDSRGNKILSSPISFVVEINSQRMVFPAGRFSFKEKTNGLVSWESITENNLMKIVCHGEMEFDGRLNYTCEVTSKGDIVIQDIRLELPMKKEFATYMMGMGRMGGFTPKTHLSRWKDTEDSFWIGGTDGGIHCELRNGNYNGPLLNLYKPSLPYSWFNGQNGGFRIDSDQNSVIASAYSGFRNMYAGQTVSYEFALIITPVKELDLKTKFGERYYHSGYPAFEPSQEVQDAGGNILNLHHATTPNPYINYPFIAQDEMKEFVQKWHDKNWKVKIYYTVRELSNHLTEIWALRSLGFEVLSDGGGGGYQWLREHLVDNYTPQWYTHLGNGEVDAAILNGGESRWYNYYVEGLAWLVKNMNIDGIYLDDVSYDRHILKRMRRVMDMIKPGCLIDLHSNTAFSLGPANQYMEFFPYIDQTWFGEGFNFDLMPADFWLTEVSGIPWGINNDLLLHMAFKNRRGMLFGMSKRGFAPMWKLWDEFGIADSKMIGFWEKQPVVTTDQNNVYATAYVKEGKTLVAIGSWVDKPVNVKLNIDWNRLGLKASDVTITAPEIKDYQKERSFNAGDVFPVDAQSDLLLIISKK